MATHTNGSSIPAAADQTGFALGDRLFPSRYFLAPLAGYTHLAFRRAIRELGGLGLATTDLVHATQLCGGHRGRCAGQVYGGAPGPYAGRAG